MYLRQAVGATCCALLLAFAGCGGGGNAGPDAGADAGGPAMGPGEYKADYRSSSQFFTQMTGYLRGSSPHGTTQIWYSANLKDMLAQRPLTTPEGSTAIKEFDKDGERLGHSKRRS